MYCTVIVNVDHVVLLSDLMTTKNVSHMGLGYRKKSTYSTGKQLITSNIVYTLTKVIRIDVYDA